MQGHLAVSQGVWVCLQVKLVSAKTRLKQKSFESATEGKQRRWIHDCWW